MTTYGNTASTQDQGRGSRQNFQFCSYMDRLNYVLSQLLTESLACNQPASEVLTNPSLLDTDDLGTPSITGSHQEQRWWLGQSQRFVRQPRASPTQD